jgi:hypothetical protein
VDLEGKWETGIKIGIKKINTNKKSRRRSK